MLVKAHGTIPTGGRKSMHELRPHQVEIMRQLDEFTVSDDLTAERNDKSLAAKGIDIGRHGTEPRDEFW